MHEAAEPVIDPTSPEESWDTVIARRTRDIAGNTVRRGPRRGRRENRRTTVENLVDAMLQDDEIPPRRPLSGRRP